MPIKHGRMPRRLNFHLLTIETWIDHIAKKVIIGSVTVLINSFVLKKMAIVIAAAMAGGINFLFIA